jgi:hypothetical protein
MDTYQAESSGTERSKSTYYTYMDAELTIITTEKKKVFLCELGVHACEQTCLW